MSALIYAAHHGDLAQVQELISKDTDVNLADEVLGRQSSISDTMVPFCDTSVSDLCCSMECRRCTSRRTPGTSRS